MDLGERLISDCEDLIKSDASIENIREAMNSVYRFYKKEFKGEVRLSDPRLLEIFKLEELLNKKNLPLDSDPIYDLSDVVLFPEIIDSEEKCHEALRAIVHDTRTYLSERCDLKTSALENMCFDTSRIVSKICENYGVEEQDFSLDMNLGPGLFHCFNVVSFNVGGEYKKYLVDCTYRQFFTYKDAFVERIGIPFNSGGSIGTFMMMDEGRKEVAESLLQNGYIEFTDEVCKMYLDGFVFAGRNGHYYEMLGKDVISKNDYEPKYSAREYMEIIENGGIVDDGIGRQIGVCENPNILYDSDEFRSYLQDKTSVSESEKTQAVI